MDGDSISDIIWEKALHICTDFLNEISAEGERGFTFKASRAGLKNINTKVENTVLLGMERQSVQTRKQPESMLVNSVTS